jgi:ATP:ADP antiporter, AAA family
MSGFQRIFQLLNIQPAEWPMVKRLFLLQFFQGAGIALFFTSALSQFLKRFPISELAYVFILSAFLLWITGYVCNRLEHRLSVKRLSIILTLIIAGSMLFFWAGQFVITQNWFYYLMLAWFNVLYLINNLEFWGMAAQLYDVRQSKRLFGIISSGDIPAKFLGYTFALLLVPYIGAQNLLLTGFLGVIVSLLFINKVFQSTEWKGFQHHTHKIKQHHTVSAKALWKNLISNRLIFDTAVLSMIAFTGFVLVEYAFYAEIKESKNYKTDEAFATFTAMFMGCARLFAWILKLGLTSRLVSSVGNRNALLITPIALLSFNISILLIYENDAKSNLILYVFGAAAILVDALRASINSPVLLTILQPLSTPERLRAHNIVKGVMDPFAYLAVGFLLFELYNWHVYKLALLSWILIAVSVLWIIYVIRVHKQYIKTLIQTISSRYFQTDDVQLTGKATIEKIATKIETGTELEVLYLLKLLEKEKAQDGLI